MKRISLKRLMLFLIVTFIVIVFGISYAIFVSYTNWGIPCFWQTITGYKCPTCGVTTMFVSLFKCDLLAAFMANPVLLIFLIPIGVIFGRYIKCYLFVCPYSMRKWEKAILVIFVISLFVFCIVRNIN